MNEGQNAELLLKLIAEKADLYAKIESLKEAAECAHHYVYEDSGSGPSEPDEIVCFCDLCGFEKGSTGLCD